VLNCAVSVIFNLSDTIKVIAGFITIPVVSLSVKLSEIKGYLRGIKLNSKAVSKKYFHFEFSYKRYYTFIQLLTTKN
jgi:hypothetical protein